MSHDDFVASDIGKMKPSGLAHGGSADGGSGGAYGPGEGPGGAVLYRAEWYREPSDAQLGGYLPSNGPPRGWGEIACQTVKNYRVENCQILAESPRGSGFARAVQEGSVAVSGRSAAGQRQASTRSMGSHTDRLRNQARRLILSFYCATSSKGAS